MSLIINKIARLGLIAMGLAAGAAAPSLAAPSSLMSRPAAAQAASADLLQVQERCEFGRPCRPDRDWGREGDRGGRGWERDRRDDRRWEEGRRWDRDRDAWHRPPPPPPPHWRRPPPPRDYGRGPGIYFQFGQPAYRDQPRYVQPRPAPRLRLSQAHVNWCYNRYRSYRAWDNTFQPYNGPRQQCWSPFS